MPYWVVLQTSVQTVKPSVQQVFWHSGCVFPASLLHVFLHFFKDFGFLLHFLILIVHFLPRLPSLRSPQLTLGGGSEGLGVGGGADGGSPSHKPQVFWQFLSFFGL